MSFIERRQRTTDSDGVLQFLEISAPSFPGPLHLVNDTQDWMINGVDYIGLPFRIKLPTDATGTPGAIEIEMDNVGQNITDDLERLGPNEIVEAVVRISDRAEPGTFYREFPMPIVRVSLSATTATATASMDSLMRQQACRLRANEFTLPGLF